MRKVQLLINDIVLGEIIDDDFSLVENQDNINLAKKYYPLQMRYFKNGMSGIIYPVELLLSALDREDIIKMAQIQNNDKPFDKLYKLAGINVESINGFKIRQK